MSSAGSSKSWPAPAKLNLFVHVTGRRADGYHELETAFQLLDYGDRLDIEVRSDGRLVRGRDIRGVSEGEDLSLRAARLLQDASETTMGAEITLHKRLPVGGGLGGGSSDAATVLVALNCLWGLNWPAARLAELGGRLGADVPVFVQGESAWAEGIGDVLSPLPEQPARWYLVLKPPVPVSTAEIYQAPELTRNTQAIKIHGFLAGRGQNDFLPVVRARYPAVGAALDWLGQYAEARLTGTGACIFAAFATEAEARDVLAQRPAELEGFVARGVQRSPLLDRLAAE